VRDDTVPVGPFLRGSVAGAATARAAGRLLAHQLRAPFLDGERRSREERRANADAVHALYSAAAKLRGTALKVAQILHWESGVTADGTADVLHQACYQAPPMVSSLVVGIFGRELGRAPWDLFDHFELVPFAAASLGQVHAARSGGRDICIKVRYPGIAATIGTDITALRVVANSLPQRALLLRLLRETEARLREECDYELERTRTQWFAEHLGVQGVDVPETIPAFCSESLLAQQRLRGTHLREWLAAHPAPQARDRCAAALDAVFTRSLYEIHRVHADPNPGNYLFRDDGSVGLIDFGCVKVVTPEFAARVSAIIRAHVRGDDEGAFEQTLAFGLFGDLTSDAARDLDREILQPFVKWLVKPLQVDSFDFGTNLGFAAECGRRFLAVVKGSPGSVIYSDLLFVNRTLYGLYRTFEAMGARVRLRNRWVSD
jgi:predicted unusual protein kinase regulating ubiquinone biosynthesis (AarF/ABC1/UbiB family)